MKTGDINLLISRHYNATIRFLSAFARLRKATISFVTSVCRSTHKETTRVSMDGILLNLVSDDISKFCRENYCFIKIWQE